MLVMLDTISAKEFVLLPPSHAQLVNSDTMEFVTLPVPQELANKETSVRELALLEHGPTMEDAIELAQLNSPPLMLVLNLAPVELPLSTESAKLDLKLVLQVNSGMDHPTHARPANTHAQNAL